MAEEHLIGVDLGTSVVKATVFRTDGRALADATRETKLYTPCPGQAYQQPEDFCPAVLDCLGEVVAKADLGPGEVAAIGFDGQMGGALGIDMDWQPITPWFVSTLDTRYVPYLKQMQERAGESLVRLSGAMPFTTPRLLWWEAEHPDVYERIHKVMILGNYVAGVLAGLRGDQAFVDPSYIAFFGGADTARRCWSPELLEACGVPLEKLPNIVPATTVIGGLTREAARACGLAAGVPLVAGVGDQVATCLGAGLVQSGQLSDGAGTYSILAACLDRFLSDTRHGMLQTLAGPISDSHWYSIMYVTGGGLTHRWFRDQFGCEEKAQAESVSTSAYQLLDQKAANLPPGCDGLLFIPHLFGRSCPEDPDVRGTWIGFSWNHHKEHFYRSVLEGIAYDYAETLSVIREYFPDIVYKEVRATGGGANSDLWNQIKADVLGLPYLRLQREDLAALGCSVIAGHAVGIYPDIADAARCCAQTTVRYEPSPEAHRRYAVYSELYCRAFGQLRGLYGELAAARDKCA